MQADLHRKFGILQTKRLKFLILLEIKIEIDNSINIK
jgi:hypothetical protein